MEGKNVLITGASSGVGLAMACGLAARGAYVLMVARDAERARGAQERVARGARGPAPELFLADLSSQAAVRRLAEEVRTRVSRLDVLINNAGAAFPGRELSVDGIERTLATNHLAPFLLTALLLDAVHAASAGRIITVTAGSHSRSIDFRNLQLERGYHFFRAYNLSKLGNILFTYELARRLAGLGITANCFSPGPTATNFGRGASGLLGVMNGLVRVLGAIGVARSPEQGARTGVLLASEPELAGVSGKYFVSGRPSRSRRITHDPEVAAELWQVSERLCGLSFEPARARPSGGTAR